ncbi:hypothetical protein [Haloterrigena salifodinae]|uniref:hypothetical protein n=1 Tax=Haloterrigena salifodinae TaxID=2675099 RepID=UPI000F87F47D|nr:hypothetical protein [Haloterrigena salifodinae]
MLGGLATTAAALSLESSPRLLAIAVATFATGAVVGAGIAGRLHGLPGRLGQTWVRRLAIICGALPFAAVIVASLPWSLEPQVKFAALGSACAVAISGILLARVAENGYVDAATEGDEPVASWRWYWSPSGSRTLDLIQFLMWGLLAVSSAVVGDWWSAVLGTSAMVLGAVVSVTEGRWTRWFPDASSEAAEIRVYEHGFATERPYRRQFVPWSSITHVRLRGDELVIDRGRFDHRFDQDALEDPEALREAIDRRLETAGRR